MKIFELTAFLVGGLVGCLIGIEAAFICTKHTVQPNVEHIATNSFEDGVLWGGLASDYTRRDQGYMPLEDRLALARRLKAQIEADTHRP